MGIGPFRRHWAIRRNTILVILVVVVFVLLKNASVVKDIASNVLNTNKSNNYYENNSITINDNNQSFITMLLRRTTEANSTNKDSNENLTTTASTKDLLLLPDHRDDTFNHGTKTTKTITMISTIANKRTNNSSRQTNRANDDDNLVPSNATDSFSSAMTAPTTTTIVVKVTGEMGNFLSKLATGFGLQRWAQDRYNMTTSIVIRHQKLKRWKSAADNIQRCFPYFRFYDFELGNSKEYETTKRHQQKWLGNLTSSLLMIGSAHDEYDIEETLSTLYQIRSWANHSYFHAPNTTKKNGNKILLLPNISLPYLKADYLAMIDFWIDKYYDDYRSTFFEFNETACCQLKPDPDESVFHFRNFLKEIPRRGKDLGFEELNPNDTARQLFRNLRAGDKVAITSRYSSHKESMQPYVDALVDRGIQVRVITGQSAVQDFCFLMHAKKELVGNAESSFALWAGYLGNASRVRLYSIDSPSRRSSILFGNRVFKYYNWTHPQLKQKVLFELYNAGS